MDAYLRRAPIGDTAKDVVLLPGSVVDAAKKAQRRKRSKRARASRKRNRRTS